MSAVGLVVAAWSIEGASPRTHRSAVAHVRKGWPVLARRIDRVVEQQNDPEALTLRKEELVELLKEHRDSMSPEHGVMQWIAGAWPHLHKAFKRLLAEYEVEQAEAEPVDEVYWRIEMRFGAGIETPSTRWHPHGPKVDEEVHVRRMEADLEHLREEHPGLTWRIAKHTIETVA